MVEQSRMIVDGIGNGSNDGRTVRLLDRPANGMTGARIGRKKTIAVSQIEKPDVRTKRLNQRTCQHARGRRRRQGGENDCHKVQCQGN